MHCSVEVIPEVALAKVAPLFEEYKIYPSVPTAITVDPCATTALSVSLVAYDEYCSVHVAVACEVVQMLVGVR